MRDPENIAVLLPNWVGDVVMATPALRALRERFSAARITHIGRPLALELLGGDVRAAGDCEPLADGQLEDISFRPPRLWNLLRQARRMRSGRFDLAVLLRNSFRSALLCRLGRARRRAGYDRDGRGWLLSEKLTPKRQAGRYVPVPTMDYYNDLAAMLGANVESRRMSLPLCRAGEAAAETLLEDTSVDASAPLVMINGGASYGSSKLWAARRFAAVADALTESRNAQIILNAAPAEREIVAEIRQAMNHAPAIDLSQRPNNISLVKSLLARTTLLITNDTGARHIAAAMGAAVVTIFGSTDPTWAQIDYPKERIVRVEVSCGPCQQKRCPLPAGSSHHQCMAAITEEMVLAAAEDLLAERSRTVRGPA